MQIKYNIYIYILRGIFLPDSIDLNSLEVKRVYNQSPLHNEYTGVFGTGYLTYGPIFDQVDHIIIYDIYIVNVAGHREFSSIRSCR